MAKTPLPPAAAAGAPTAGKITPTIDPRAPVNQWTDDVKTKISEIFHPTKKPMVGPVIPSVTQKAAVRDSYSIQERTYPLNRENSHFVRFFINLDEESKLLRRTDVAIMGNVDNSTQNRIRNVGYSQGQFEAMAIIGGGVAAATMSGVHPDSKLANKVKGLEGFGGNAARAGVGLFNSAWARGATGALIAYGGTKFFDVSKKLKRLAANITLYTPNSVTMSQNVAWDNYSDALPELLKSDLMDGVTELMSNPGLSTAEKAVELVKKGGKTIGKGVRILGTAGTEFVQSATRTVMNPKRDMLFKAVDRRSFTFDYQFAPKTSEEAIEVANIIYMFRMFALPEVIEGYNHFLYTYPAEFDIEYGYKTESGEEQNKYINKISSCILQSINVNYAPNGSFQSLENGEPVQVNMTLQFTELETMHRDRVTAGY